MRSAILLMLLGTSRAFTIGSHVLKRTSNLSAAGTNAISGIGSPSNPGWESGRLNRLTEWADEVQPNRPIICEYEPKGRWLWSKWNGTVLKATWRSVLFAMLTVLAIDYVARGCNWSMYKLFDVQAVDTTSVLIKRLSAVTKVWEYQLSLSTFILTFFLSHAFSYWQKVYSTTRMIQGRINGEYAFVLMLREVQLL
jgi:hypothetical protein